jgi:hypothetical protein
LDSSLTDRLAIKVIRDRARARIARLKKMNGCRYAGRLPRKHVSGDQQQPRRAQSIADG